jgi:hypothetical protein
MKAIDRKWTLFFNRSPERYYEDFGMCNLYRPAYHIILTLDVQTDQL